MGQCSFTDRVISSIIFTAILGLTDLEQFLNLRPPQCLFFNDMTCSNDFQPFAKLCELRPLKGKTT